MTKAASPSKEAKEKKPNKFGYLVLFVFSIFLIGGFGYFFKKDALKHQQIQRQDHKSLLFSLTQKDEEVKKLRGLILKLQTDQENKTIGNTPSYNELRKRVSANLQKVIMQQKLERRLLHGKDFSIELHTLDVLLGPVLNTPDFEMLRSHATEGIPTTYEIEKTIRKTPLEATDHSKKNWFLKLFSGFFTISSRKNKENFDMLIELIRTDRMQKSIEVVDEYFPEKIAWKRPLEKRLAMKRALKKIENLVFDSVRV